MEKRHAGCIAVALVFVAVALAGCVGSEAGGGSASDTDETSADNPEQTGSSTNDAQNATNATDSQGDEADASEEADKAKEEQARTPSDAMSADPVESKPGMARFEIEDTAGTSVFAEGADPVTYTINNPGDLTFLDVHLTTEANSEDPSVTDFDLYLYNETGDQVSSSASSRTDEYLWHQPAEDPSNSYTLEVVPFLTNDASYTLKVTAWTADDWNVTDTPFTDSWQVRYEWGQFETAAFSVVWYPGDPAGVTQDDRFQFGGNAWVGCGHKGGSRLVLPCPQDPYTSISLVIDDDVAGQQVAAILASCSMDGDFYCGESDNRNDTGTDPEDCDGGASGGCPGPNELEATFCGVVQGLTRDGTSDVDGTGPGVWDQRGEKYETLNGSYEEHPGVDGIAVFLRGPQRGGGGICTQANPYTGPTTGTITLIAER